MESLTQTNRHETLCPHLHAACMFTAPPRHRVVAPIRLTGILAQLDREGLL